MRPLLPVLLFFISGILAPSYIALPVRLLAALFFISLTLLLFLYIRKIDLPCYLYLGVTSLPFLFLGALFISSVNNPVIGSDHIVRYLRNSAESGRMAGGVKPVTVDFEAIVVSRPKNGKGGSTVVVEAKRVKRSGGWVPASGLVRLYVKAGLEEIGRGDKVRLLADLKEPYSFYNPGGYDYRLRLLARSIYVTGSIRHKKLFVKLKDAEGGPLSRVERVRARLNTFIEDGGYKNPSVMKALVTGDKSGLPKSLKEEFARTGTSHLLAISGLHVGTVAFLSYMLTLFLLKRFERLMLALNVKKAAAALSLVPVFLYAAIAGFPLSTVRAVIMLSVYVLSYMLGRGRLYLNVLAVAALLILAQNPSALFDVSFQLSFSAVAGIILLAPRLMLLFLPGGTGAGGKEAGAGALLKVRERAVKHFLRALLKRLYRWTVTALIISFAATVGTLPLVLYHFNSLSTVTLAANLLSVPVTGVVVPLLLLGALVSGMWASLGSLFFITADYLITVLLFIVKELALLPWASVRLSTPSVPEILLFYLFVLLFIGYRRRRIYRYGAVAALFLLLITAVYPTVIRHYNSRLRVTYISVGQGDSALLELPGGTTMLIDGGGFYGTDFDTGRSIVAPLLWRKHITKIDYMVVSHAQRDHIGGLRFIAENFKVGELWWNGSGNIKKLVEAVKAVGGTVVITGIEAGGAVNAKKMMRIGGVTVEVLWPVKGERDSFKEDLNNRSQLVRVEYKGTSFLFTGDIEEKGERAVLASAAALRLASTVLKAPHHASSSSSTGAFISAVSPRVVVVSSGRYNPFGFPHASSLRRYARQGAKIFRTDMDGAVEITTDGNGFKVRTYAQVGGAGEILR